MRRVGTWEKTAVLNVPLRERLNGMKAAASYLQGETVGYSECGRTIHVLVLIRRLVFLFG